MKNVGWKFWSGLVAAINANWDWLKGIGSRIWDGLKEGLGKVTGNGGGSVFSFAKGGDVPAGNNDRTSALWSAMGAMRAQDGIEKVPGVGISDHTPILARAGERVLTPQQARGVRRGRLSHRQHFDQRGGGWPDARQERP